MGFFFFRNSIHFRVQAEYSIPLSNKNIYMIYHDRCLPSFEMATREKEKKKKVDLFAQETFIVVSTYGHLHQSRSDLRLRGTKTS